MLASLILVASQAPQTAKDAARSWQPPKDEWSASQKDERQGFGCEVARVGDLDGDGSADIVIGSFDRVAALPTTRMLTDIPKPTGKLFAYSAATHAQLWVCSWRSSCIAFGECAAAIPDQDGDGVQDIAVGVTDLTLSGGAIGLLNDSGVALVSGKRGSFIKKLDLESSEVLALWWVTNRWNEKGGELLCCVRGLKRTGRVVDLSLSTGKPVWKSQEFAGVESCSLITRTSPDAPGEIVLGCPWLTGDDPRADMVHVVSAETGKLIRQIEAPSKHEEFGSAVCWIPDQDGDRLPEIVIGAPEASAGGASAGAIYFWCSHEGKVVKSLRGGSAGPRFGRWVTSGTGLAREGEVVLAVGSDRPSAPGLFGSIAIVDVSEPKVVDQISGNSVWFFTNPGGNAGYARREQPSSWDPKDSPTILIRAPR